MTTCSLACTFLGMRHMLSFPSSLLTRFGCTGPSFKRGPPKGYIHAIEQRWHQVESILGAILSSKDPHVQALINNLRKDKLACDILGRVDSGPFVSISYHFIRATILMLNGSGHTGSNRPPQSLCGNDKRRLFCIHNEERRSTTPRSITP